MSLQKIIENQIKEIIQNKYQYEAQPKLEIPKNNEYGDLACTICLNLAKPLKKPPIKLAEELRDELNAALSNLLEAEVAPPGFLNFKLTPEAFALLVHNSTCKDLIQKTSDQKKILIEYVSANPTGDLHLGHGRGAVVGSAVANILRATGKPVQTEFYINDAGEQIAKLGRSAWSLYSGQSTGEDEYPPQLIEPYLTDLKEDKTLTLEVLTEKVKEKILNKQREVLSRIKVDFDCWISEKKGLHESGRLKETLQGLKDKNLTYEKDGALWLSSEELGDERDRVLIKSENGRPTYLAGDLAYHLFKFEKADELLDIFGADHKGQELSLQVALKAFGKDIENFKILFIQFVSLVEGGQEVKMSKRTGSLITVEEVVDRVGPDAFRFMLLTSNVNNRLAFDVDVASRTDDQNPVFYVQYAHARACSILRNATQNSPDGTTALTTTEELEEVLQNPNKVEILLGEGLSQNEKQSTKSLLVKLSFIEKEVYLAADNLNPSGLVHYLLDIANHFHSFYGHCRAIDPLNKELSLARLALIKAFQRVLNYGLSLLSVTAPERM